MTIATHTIDATSFSPSAPSVRTPRIRRIAKAEWTKLRTLPSTWRTVVMAFVISVALGAILCVSQVQQWSKMTAGQRQTFDPTACSLFGIVFVGAVLLAALGVRTMTSEYVTGMIRSTFAATPTRRLVLAAKAGVTAFFVFPVALLTSVVSFEVGQRIFSGKHLEVSFAHPGRPPSGGVRCPGGEPYRRHRGRSRRLIRHTAAATTTLVLVIVGGVTIGQLLPAGLRQYVPGTALQAAVTVNHSTGLLTPGAAIVVLWVYAAIALAAASIRAAHRDA